MITLNERIRQFYNSSTPLWLDTWGEHMHHGFYGIDGNIKKENKQAQIDLINEVINWANIKSAHHILDAGCGVGGSSRYLSKKFDASVLGLTLSNVQAAAAEKYNKAQGLENKVSIMVKDMLTLDKKYGQFDLIWSLESAEHIPDKKALLHLFNSLLETKGKCVIVTWCISSSYGNLTDKQQDLIQKIEKLYHLPPMISLHEYTILMKEAGFINVHSADWSAAVAPFWNAVIRSAIKWKSIFGLLRAGTTTIKGAWAMQYMKKGFREGTIKFIVIQGEKI
ncbi:MAG: class I SAM-dependent methyltransferase [Chitinophagales bacterium]|jgi:tocopherol O-methyltransferase|nr:class I SAM-dependent methyltransferase [Chitinophagales bacterium]